MKFNQPSSSFKLFSLSFSVIIPLYFLLLMLYLLNFISGFMFVGSLLIACIVFLVFIIIFRQQRPIVKFSSLIILSLVILIVYEGYLIQYESITYSVDTYREPEEFIPQTNLFMLTVGLNDIQYIEDEQLLLKTLEENEIEPLNIEKVSNLDRYQYKTTAFKDLIMRPKSEFEVMGENVQAFIGHELPFVSELLQRDELTGNSAGLILGLYALMDQGFLHNQVPIAVTGALSPSGEVLEVGGIRAKVLISGRNDFPYMIVPTSNFQLAEEVKIENALDIEIIAVEHIDEAVDFINMLSLNHS